MESFLLQLARQVLVVQLDVLRRLPAAVHDPRHPDRVTQAAARTFALRRTRHCVYFDCHVLPPLSATIRDQTAGFRTSSEDRKGAEETQRKSNHL